MSETEEKSSKGNACCGETRFEPLLVTPSHPNSDPLESHDAGRSASRAVAGTSVAGLLAAFMASLCCIGPLVFAALGVGVGATGTLAGVAGFLKALLPYRPLFIGLAMVLLGVSFYAAYRKPAIGDASCQVGVPASGVRRNRWLLWILAGLAMALVLAPYWLELVTGS